MIPTIALLLALQRSPQEMMVRRMALAFGVEPERAACIVRLESEWDPAAIGDDGAAVGLWQWHMASWRHVRRQMGLSTEDRRMDPVESTATALFAIGRLGLGRWWTADRQCHYKEPSYATASTTRHVFDHSWR